MARAGDRAVHERRRSSRLRVEGGNVRMQAQERHSDARPNRCCTRWAAAATPTGLGLEELGIPIGKYGHIEKVDPITYQTTVPNIYAAGDVIGPPALASTSMEQGRLAMCHAFELKYKTKLATDRCPPASTRSRRSRRSGMTEQDCQKEGHPVRRRRGRVRPARARADHRRHRRHD